MTSTHPKNKLNPAVTGSKQEYVARGGKGKHRLAVDRGYFKSYIFLPEHGKKEKAVFQLLA